MYTQIGLVGFDRKIRLSWLDATADWTAQGLSTAEIRIRLDRLLDGEVAGCGTHTARGKTITVLLHIWVLVPDEILSLRNDGLDVLGGLAGSQRVIAHWGMCLATYPFFRDVAATTGRLLSLQGRASLSQIVRRVTEAWGARSTIPRAVQRVVRSFVSWGVLAETSVRGIFEPAPKIVVDQSGIGAWLLEAGLADSGRGGYPLHMVTSDASYFPLDLRLTLPDINPSPRLEILHQGFDGPIITLKRTS